MSMEATKQIKPSLQTRTIPQYRDNTKNNYFINISFKESQKFIEFSQKKQATNWKNSIKYRYLRFKNNSKVQLGFTPADIVISF